MPLHVSVFADHKAGASPHECEDVAVVSAVDEAEAPVRLALADGASESMLASMWARRLAEHFAQACGSSLASGVAFATAAARAASGWPRLLADYQADRVRDGRPIAWYERDGLAKGAFATVLAVQLHGPAEPGEPGVWLAAALGDTCVFQVRDERLVTAFPLADAAEFGTSPSLAHSNESNWELVARRCRVHQGHWRPHDDFYLCTDALAAWFLREAAADRRPWEALRDLGTDALAEFPEWVAERRADGMRNDDTTLVRVTTW